MAIIDIIDLFKINQSILKNIDEDIINHSEESSYIAYKIAEKLGYSDKEIENLILASALHDIGAYKVDEIDNIKKFEIIDPGKHSIYGYCLLKTSGIFKGIANSVLYHHNDYRCKERYIDSIYIPEDSFIISLADRISILCNSMNYEAEKIKSAINNMNIELFDPNHMQILFNLIKEEYLIEDIVTGKYKSIINNEIKNIYVELNKIKNYLVFLPLAINFYSFETSIHTVSVASATRKICEKMNLNNEYKEKIEIASYLHDIGKVCIPKTILEKNGKLSKDEYEIMKKHVYYSRKILQDANIDEELINLACNHHEKLDGSGYSIGLKSNDLSIGDRIISVSDIFCALTEKRVYKKPFTKDKVLQILNDMVDKNYIDETIVNIIKIHYEEILNYTINNKENYKNILGNMIKEYKYITKEMDRLYKSEYIN